ncbi:MAG: tetratricopeptide repeat protein [Candidatus Acidiferrales bacterium]
MPLVFFALCIAMFQARVVKPAPANPPAQTSRPPLTPQEVANLETAAASGDATAQYKLALAYENGDGVPQDPKTAFEWCKKSADQGNAEAETELGVMYRLGEGVAEDRQLAVQWYEKASRQGNAVAMFDLGGAYYNGDGVEIDDSVSYAWFVLAKEAGDPQAVPAVARAESELPAWRITVGYKRLAQLCGDGKYAPENQVESASWWLKAAERGDQEAELGIADKLLHGQGVPQDLSRARYWCNEAAKRGEPQGDYCLGYIYQRGLGVSADAKKARNWYEAGADRNNVAAIRALAQMDEAGEGSKVDLVGAFVWYAKLAVANDKDAQQQIVRLRSKMSAKDWREVQKRLPRFHVDPGKLNAILQSATN